MDFAPPPSPGSRIQELGDDLIVRFRPRPNWAVIVFAAIWLAAFAVGVFPDYPDTLTGNEWWELPFAIAGCVLMLIVGLVLPVVWIAWQFVGEITLTVTPERLEVQRCIGKVSRAKRYDPTSVRDVRAAPILGGEDNDIPRGDFGLELVRDGKKSVFVGKGMGEREAEWVSATVRSHIDPRRSWGAPEDDVPAPASPTRPSRFGLRSAIFPAVVVLLLVYLVISTFRDEGTRPAVTEGFPNVRAYAEQTTRSMLLLSHMRPISEIDCGDDVSWSAWSCEADVEETAGALTGRRFTYRCFPTRGELPDGRQGDLVECGAVAGTQAKGLRAGARARRMKEERVECPVPRSDGGLTWPKRL